MTIETDDIGGHGLLSDFPIGYYKKTAATSESIPLTSDDTYRVFFDVFPGEKMGFNAVVLERVMGIGDWDPSGDDRYRKCVEVDCLWDGIRHTLAGEDDSLYYTGGDVLAEIFSIMRDLEHKYSKWDYDKK